MLTDTIIAVSSPATGGGIRAIIRLSGPSAWRLAREVVELPAEAGVGYHGSLVLPLLHARHPFAAAILFKGPRSFTGEDVAELHVPNSPALVRACMDRMLDCGGADVRLAGPGEFSARAFFNGKIDLTEAEGIAATINAGTEIELRAATSLREGTLHKQIQRHANELGNLLAMVEAGIDFSDEEGVRFIDGEELGSRLSQNVAGVQWWLAHAVRIDRLDRLPTVVLIGEPNVGKSSLINALAGRDRSITSEIAGTTRDMLSVVIPTPRGEVRLVDVPGEELPTDDLRKQMMEARERALMEADLVLDIVASETEVISGLLGSVRYGADYYTVQNKVDLLPPAAVRTFEYLEDSGDFMTFRGEFQMVSAKTGWNIENLREAIGKLAHRRQTISQQIPALNQRHRILLQGAKEALHDAESWVDTENMGATRHELLAADLRRALDLLGQITGIISPDDVLGRIFSQFCIGK
jgi:tRNA modification GTPase